MNRDLESMEPGVLNGGRVFQEEGTENAKAQRYDRVILCLVKASVSGEHGTRGKEVDNDVKGVSPS